MELGGVRPMVLDCCMSVPAGPPSVMGNAGQVSEPTLTLVSSAAMWIIIEFPQREYFNSYRMGRKVPGTQLVPSKY